MSPTSARRDTHDNNRRATSGPFVLLQFRGVLAQPASRRPDIHAARVLQGQLDISARVIWFLERFDWASKVRWPSAQRLARIRATAGEMGH